MFLITFVYDYPVRPALVEIMIRQDALHVDFKKKAY